MKVLKLETTYYSNGVLNQKHVLLPYEANGNVFGWIDAEQVIQDGIKVQGAAFADVYVYLIDLETLDAKTGQQLLAESDYETFRDLLAIGERELVEYMEEVKADMDSQYQYWDAKQEANEFYKSYDMEEPETDKTYAVYQVFLKKAQDFFANHKTTTIKVLASEAEAIQVLMLQNGFTLIEE